MIPLRFTGEILGAKVGWESILNVVTCFGIPFSIIVFLPVFEPLFSSSLTFPFVIIISCYKNWA